MPANDVVLSATFTAIEYTVSFNKNGGTGNDMAAQSFTYDKAQNLTANAYERTGYSFAGWATTAEGDVLYSDKQSVSNLATTQDANVELFAKWTKNEFALLNDDSEAAEKNAIIISSYANDGKVYEVTLSGRTLTADNWNTLCLPFNLSAAQIESIFGSGTKVKTLSSYSNDGSTVTITYEDATTIEAGKPYIIKPTNTVVNPVFTGVTINNTMNDVTVGGATFKGTYSPVALTANDKRKLFLANNMLWFPTANLTVKSCRAYFELTDEVPETTQGAPSIVIDYGDESTGILSIDHSPFTIDHSSGAWYTLDGRKLDGKPAKKGMYIVNGRKAIVK